MRPDARPFGLAARRPVVAATAAFSALLIAVALAVPAYAAQRTFVATSGDDANACSRALPCRSFATAALATDPDGEIVVLDSGGYGAVTLTQSISIISPPGVYAGVSVFGSEGVLINSPGINVTLRGITINGQGGSIGLRVQQAAVVHVAQCVIAGMAGAGLQADVSAGAELYVDDVALHDNGGAGARIHSGSASFDRVRFENNAAGGLVGQSTAGGVVRISVRDSLVTGNGANGVDASTGASSTLLVAIDRALTARNSVGVHVLAVVGTAHVTIDRSLLTDNIGDGVFAEGSGATLVLSSSTFARNGANGIRQSTSSTIESAGNNVSRGNGTDVSGTIVTVGTL